MKLFAGGQICVLRDGCIFRVNDMVFFLVALQKKSKKVKGS